MQSRFGSEKLAEGWFGRVTGEVDYAALEERVAALEQLLGRPQPFIEQELRPDLSRGALTAEDDLEEMNKRMAEGDAQAKRSFDSKLTDSDQ
jgi:hypothetical protein